MKKQNIVYAIVFLTIILVSGLISCDEKIHVDMIPDQLIPVVGSFEPQQAEIGQLVNISGEDLKYVDKVFIGSAEAVIKYKVNNSLVVIEITNEITGGNVKVQNKVGESSESESSFLVVFKQPVLDQVPVSGRINEEVLVTGSNLQYIKQLIIGDVAADIVAQKSTELVFKVPFYLANQATMSYQYISANGQQAVSLAENGFSIVKSWPSFASVPEKAMINSEITIIGENMNVVDSVYIGTQKVNIVSKDPLTLVIAVPNDAELEGKQSVFVYSYGGQELSSGPVLRIITKLERMLENFEAFTGDPFAKKKTISPVYETGLNGNANIEAPEGNFYASLKIDYDQSIVNNGGSTFSEFYFKNADNSLIDFSEYTDPWVHMWINTNNTAPYFVFYCDLFQATDGVTRGTHYVKRLNSADYGDGWQLFAWRLKDLLFRSGSTADPYSSETFSIYNLKTFRMQFRTASDEPLETSEFNFDSFMVVDGKLKAAHNVSVLNN